MSTSTKLRVPHWRLELERDTMDAQKKNTPLAHESLIKLKRLYLQSVPAGSIVFDSLVPAGRVDWGYQDHLYNTILSKDATAYPPSGAYTRRFLKFLITSLEENLAEDEELHDSILTLYSDLMSSPDIVSDATRPTFITYLLPPIQSLSREETRVVISERKSVLSADGHTGARTWEAALALGEFFIVSPLPISKPIRECRVLELGAGTAFTSILLSKLGARYVLATDGDERVCENIHGNIFLNRNGDNMSVSRLLWGPCQENSTIYTNVWDLIIGGDITYDTRDISDLVYTLKKLLKANMGEGCKAIISATVRNESTLHEFDKELSTAGLSFEAREVGEPGRRLWYYESDTAIRIYTIYSS
ncbi:hypothetical protein TWF730_002181 [Orbilia blumenaviensis]|uniref:Uncharacterized protein n=1 Tax=Orbilia blumenaviensis TaxID=1796055 RepID=A0AAV9UGW3_9PEZI